MESVATEGLSLMSIGMFVLVLWFVMTKKTKESIGSTIQHTAGFSSDFLIIQREKQAVGAVVEINELLETSGKTTDDVEAFKARLGLGK